MLRTTFIASSDTLDVIYFSEKYNILKDEYWIKGTKEYGRVKKNSGFKLFVTDYEDSVEHFNDLKSFLKEVEDLIDELKENNIDMYFDIGMTIDAPEYMSKYFTLDNNILHEIAKAGLGIEISTYIASEE